MCGFCSLMFWYYFASIRQNIIVPDTECQYPNLPDPRLESLKSCTKWYFVYKILCAQHMHFWLFLWIQYLGKHYISILSTRNVIWTLGVGVCDVSRWKVVENFYTLKFLIFWNHLYKVYKIQHFCQCICILGIIFLLIIRSWPCPKCTFMRLYTTLNLKTSKGGWGVSRKTSIWCFSWTKLICDASLRLSRHTIAQLDSL